MTCTEDVVVPVLHHQATPAPIMSRATAASTSHPHHLQNSNGQRDCVLECTTSSSAAVKATECCDGRPRLSLRGAKHAQSVTPFWTAFDEMLRDVYCPTRNPNGVINMGIANNSLMEKELLDYFHTHLKLDPTDLTYGTSLHGSTRLFDALAKHYNSNAFSPVHHVLPSQILTGPGCGSLLDQIFEHLADPGDACLLAAPYYNGFDADLATRVGVRCVPVYSKHGDGTESERFKGDGALDGFEQALLECSSPVRAIIVCNPNNPVGKCYDRSALLAYGQFAQKHNLHLVFDEIYALSTFPTSDDDNPQPFISALNIDWSTEANCDPSRIHILSSASKDFGLNGFRIGTFVSQFNPDLINAMKVTGKLYMVSSPADALFSALLNDENFYSSFVSTNRTRLTEAYEHIKAWCVRHGIPYKPSNAGHFLLVDLSAYCHDGESQLWSKALDKCKVCITPAASNYHFPQKGWFRITFSMPNEVLNLGLRRLESALGIDVQPRLSPGSLRVYSALCGTRSKRVREEDGSPSAIKEAKRLVGHADVSGAGAQEQNVVNVGNKVGCLG